MLNIGDESEQQIASLISNRGNDYVRVVKEIKNILRSYKISVEGKNAIYEIRSRGDYQGGNELKTQENISKKIIERKRQEKPYYAVKDVEDIIGIKVICIYPSDAELIKKYIEKEQRLRMYGSPDLISLPSGYRAIHITVSVTEPLELQDLKCEIQVVTMLQEAWSFKSHNLVYKPGWKVEKNFYLLSCCLSRLLTALDHQSEVIKSQIEKIQKMEEQRRVNAIRDHEMKLIGKELTLDEKIKMFYNKKHISFENVEDPNNGMQLLKYLVKEINIDGVLDEEIDYVVSNMNAYEEKFKIFEDEDKYKLWEDLNRIILIIALIEETGKYRPRAIGYSDKLIWYTNEKSINRAKAYLFKGRVLSAFKRYDEALAETEKAMEVTEISNLAKNNWAYFATEYIDEQRMLATPELTTDEIEAFTVKATKLIKESIDDELDSNKKMMFNDTLGFMKLALGKTPEEVKEGLNICIQSLEADSDQELAKLYLRRHEILAYQRLIELLDS